MINFNVVFNEGESFDVELDTDQSFDVSFGLVNPLYNYTGPYEVMPGTTAQTLPTQDKTLSENVVVDAVASGSAIMADASVTFNPIVTVDDEGVITASVNDTYTMTPTVVPGYVESGTPGTLTATGNTQYQMYKRTSDDLTVNGQTVTAPLGYYPQDASKAVPIILKPTVMRPDAELIQSYSYDKHAVSDESITLPAYTTTAQTLKASANLSPTITMNGDDYTFFVVERFLTIPEYNVTSVAKGRQEYTYCTYLYDLTRVPANTVKTIDGTKAITSVSNLINTMT